MYWCDMYSCCIYVCDYDGQIGVVVNICVFVDLCDQDVDGVYKGLFDGFIVDVDGCFWNVEWGGNCLMCYVVDGCVLVCVFVLVLQFICLVFGGEVFDMLYLMIVCDGLLVYCLVEDVNVGVMLQFVVFNVCGLLEGWFGYVYVVV